jgi:hypothetical protein
MNKFFANLLLFIIPLTILSYGLDIFFSKNLLKSNESPGNYNSWNDIYESNINSDVLIYGSSRASMQVDPQILEDSLQVNVYNLGMLGHNFLTQYLRHHEYLKHNKPPKQIILCLDYFSFEKRIDLYESDQFLPYMLWNYNIWEYTNSYRNFSLLEHTIPLIRYFGKANAKKKAFSTAFMNSNQNPMKIKGYKSTNKPWNQAMETARAVRGVYTIRNDEKVIRLFHQFLKECKTMSIKLTIIYTPEFYKERELVSNFGETFEIFNKAISKYEFTFLDYSNDPICYDKDYFYNALHLNKKGVELFTSKLAYDLKSEKSKQ